MMIGDDLMWPALRQRTRLDRRLGELRRAGINPDLLDADELEEMLGGVVNAAAAPAPKAQSERLLVAAVTEHVDRLSDRDASFVMSLARYARLSERQMKWLRDIARRLRIDERSLASHVAG